MASYSLSDLFGYVSLTGIVNANVPDLPKPLPDGFYDAAVKKVEGNTGMYTRLVNNRTVSKLVNYGAEPLPRNMVPLGQFPATCFSTAEQMTISPMDYLALRGMNSYDLQNRGAEIIKFQVDNFRRYTDNLRNTIDVLALSRGKVHYNGDTGELLPTSSGATVTADFQIPAAQVGATIATFTGVSGAWSSASTNIPLQITKLKMMAERAHGYVPEIVLYGKNVPSQLALNDYLIEYAAREPQGFRPNWLKEGDLQPTYRYLSMLWYPAYNAFWKDSDGVDREAIDDNAIIFLPKPSTQWWERFEGVQLVPTNYNPQQGADLSGLNMEVKKVYGRGMFGRQNPNTLVPTITMVAFDNQTPVIKVPDAVYSLLSA